MGFFDKFLSYFVSKDVAVDLGTATTLIYIKGEGIVLNEPSVVARDNSTGEILAVGAEAKKMIGKTHQKIKAIRPMKKGVITDGEAVEEMLRTFMSRVQQNRLLMNPKVIVCVPSRITQVEAKAVQDSTQHAGAREVFMIPEPVAAAVGVQLPVDLPEGNMVVDIGGGTSEIAVISLSGIVSDNSISVGGDEMDESIMKYIKEKYSLLIGEQTAENIKKKIGSASPLSEELKMEIRGIDMISGIPKTKEIKSEEIREALKNPVTEIVQAIKLALEKTPPELGADIVENGIVMTGGGSLLKGLDLLIHKETNLKVKVSDNPLECVVRGAGTILENIDKYDKLLIRGFKS